MSDFHQTGVISTLHRLGRRDVVALERELVRHAEARPIALILPCLHAELRDVALKRIIDQLTNVPYLAQVIVSVDGAKSRAVYAEWLAKARSADKHSPDGTRRPFWLMRPLKPPKEVFRIPDEECHE